MGRGSLLDLGGISRDPRNEPGSSSAAPPRSALESRPAGVRGREMGPRVSPMWTSRSRLARIEIAARGPTQAVVSPGKGRTTVARPPGSPAPHTLVHRAALCCWRRLDRSERPCQATAENRFPFDRSVGETPLAARQKPTGRKTSTANRPLAEKTCTHLSTGRFACCLLGESLVRSNLVHPFAGQEKPWNQEAPVNIGFSFHGPL